MNVRNKINNLIAPIALALSLAATPALAVDQIYSPNAEKDEISLEYNTAHNFDKNAAKDNAQEHQFGVEYGATDRLVAEGKINYERAPQNSTRLSAAELEGRYQFFNQGEYWIDTGLLVSYSYAFQHQQPDSLETKLLLQKDFGKVTSTANIGFTQDIGKYAASGGPDYVFLLNTRYRYNIYFQPGIEIQSDLGQAHSLRHFDQQQDYIGPAIYGKVFGRLKYQVGYFAGVSEAASSSAARVLLEYEMHF